jgi:hypothetical protein
MIEEFAGVNLADLSAISTFPLYKDNVFDSIPEDNTFQVITGKASSLPIRYSSVTVTDIFHYCDLVHSCKTFYCLFSGSCVVASALRPNNTYCFVPEMYYPRVMSGYLFFEGLDYISC